MRAFLLIIIAFLMTGCSLCFAQSPPPPPPAAWPVRIVGRAEIFYFKNSDTSKVDVGNTLLGSHETMLREVYFSLGASFSVPGPKVTRPHAVNLTLYSYTHGSNYRYRSDTEVMILVNDKAVLSGR